MKRFLATACAVALVAFAAQANAAMYGGIKAGANFANITGDDAPDDTSMRTGFQGGLFVGTNVSEQFGFRLEGLWVQKGAKFDQDFGGTIGVKEVSAKLDYIEFPLLFVLNFAGGETLGFNLFAGPTFGFNISATTEVDGGDSDDIDNVKSFEFGAAIGAGIAKKMASGKSIGLDVRYSLGATSVIEDVGSVSTDLKNTGIGLMAFFQVPFGSSASAQ
jgi:hypothetical protein